MIGISYVKLRKLQWFATTKDNEAVAGQTLRLADGVDSGLSQFCLARYRVLDALLVHIMAARLFRISQYRSVGGVLRRADA